MKLKIYTDGACSGNPGKGGWAAIILHENTIQCFYTRSTRALRAPRD